MIGDHKHMTTPTRTPGKLGRLPHDPSKPRLTLTRAHVDALRAARTKLPTPPATVDDISQVAGQGDGYPMYGNDQYGDCVWAMIGHHIQVSTLLGLRKEVEVTTEALLKGYSDVTGFDPKDPSTDQGTSVQDALNYWRKVGIEKPDGTKDKIAAFGLVDHTDRELIADCIELFGPGCKGVDFPDSAMDQFNHHQEWTVVKGARNDGGHAILTARYALHSPSDMDTEEVTWAARQLVADPWNAEYVEELWFILTRDWFDANGVDPNGEAASALGVEFTALTDTPNPFPEPEPTPTPVPVPVPSPSPSPDPVPPTPAPVTDVRMDSADEALVAALTPWLNERHVGENHHAVQAVDRWLNAKLAAPKALAEALPGQDMRTFVTGITVTAPDGTRTEIDPGPHNVIYRAAGD